MRRRYIPLLLVIPVVPRAGVLDSVHQKSRHFSPTNNAKRDG